jgi:hypothetical protein
MLGVHTPLCGDCTLLIATTNLCHELTEFIVSDYQRNRIQVHWIFAIPVSVLLRQPGII